MAFMIHNALRVDPRWTAKREASQTAENWRKASSSSIAAKNYRKASRFSAPASRFLDVIAGRREIDGQRPKRGEDPMSTSAYTRILVVILAALALAACPGKKGKKPDETPAVYYVSPAGSDGNPGTQTSPFKTISYAVRVATRSGTTVQVDPGTYNVANGETFPITVPAGVLLIGNETSKGGGTSIVGGGGQAPGATAGVGVALLPRAGSTIAGFTITNDNPALSGRYGLLLSNSSVTLRNNTVTGATHKVGIYVDASTDHVITGNHIVDNGRSSMGSGLAFSKGGVRSKVENNIITGNAFGVEYDVDGGDLGG